MVRNGRRTDQRCDRRPVQLRMPWQKSVKGWRNVRRDDGYGPVRPDSGVHTAGRIPKHGQVLVEIPQGEIHAPARADESVSGRGPMSFRVAQVSADQHPVWAEPLDRRRRAGSEMEDAVSCSLRQRPPILRQQILQRGSDLRELGFGVQKDKEVSGQAGQHHQQTRMGV